MASPLFCDGLVYDLRLVLFFDVHLLLAGIFRLELLHANHHRGVLTAVFSPP